MKTLQDLSYAVLVQQKGTRVLDVKQGKLYKMIEKDGFNYTDLGKCIKIERIFPDFMNDGVGQIHLTFEKNNDHPDLMNHFYGDSVYSKFINVFEYKEDI